MRNKIDEYVVHGYSRYSIRIILCLVEHLAHNWRRADPIDTWRTFLLLLHAQRDYIRTNQLVWFVSFSWNSSQQLIFLPLTAHRVKIYSNQLLLLKMNRLKALLILSVYFKDSKHDPAQNAKLFRDNKAWLHSSLVS